ncbi:MAG: hypothetical protein LBT14_02350 [Treponema sp.]|jgi:hypothetical protein|nr:hypothetical protein [Treponema sp.]
MKNVGLNLNINFLEEGETKKVAAKIVSQHQARDQQEVTPGTDRAKEQEQAAKKIERIKAKAKKIGEFLLTHQPKLGSGGEVALFEPLLTQVEEIMAS